MTHLSQFFEHGQSFGDYLIYAVIFLLCGNLENIYGVTKDYGKWKHDKLNYLFMLPGAIVQFLLGLLFIKFLHFENINGIGLLPKFGYTNPIQQVLISFAIFDFGYYVYHFLMHKIKMVWPFHAVHHSDHVLNVSTSLREHPVETVIRLGHYILIACILGPAIWIVSMHQFIQIISKIIVHSNFRLSEKWDSKLSLVFLTPNMHHVHHHYQEPYTDSNYGDLLSIWDRMFGTYTHLHTHEVKFGLDVLPDAAERSFLNLLKIPFTNKFQKEDIIDTETEEISEPIVIPIDHLKSSFLLAIISLSMLFVGPIKDNSQGNLPNPKTGSIVFELKGLTPNRGYARVVLYNNPDKFLSQFGFCNADSARVKEDGTCEIVMHNLPYGKYAGSFYQDENHNYVIDRNILGMPTEPYAFSNGINAKWRIPNYNEVCFDFEKSETNITVMLNYWSKQ